MIRGLKLVQNAEGKWVKAGSVGNTGTKPKQVQKKAGEMNLTEKRYECILKEKKLSGQIKDYKYEAIKLKLDQGVTFTPDFLVIFNDNSIEYHEVKNAFIREDAKLKFKWCVQAYPFFAFKMMQYQKESKSFIKIM